MYERKHIVFEQKDEYLIKVVKRLCDNDLFPVVDKKLQMVFGAYVHRMPRSRLFWYFYRAEHPKMKLLDISDSEAADRYISEGHGYFISSMRPGVIIVGRKYRIDSLDEDLFAAYQTEVLF